MSKASRAMIFFDPADLSRTYGGTLSRSPSFELNSMSMVGVLAQEALSAAQLFPLPPSDLDVRTTAITRPTTTTQRRVERARLFFYRYPTVIQYISSTNIATAKPPTRLSPGPQAAGTHHSPPALASAPDSAAAGPAAPLPAAAAPPPRA